MSSRAHFLRPSGVLTALVLGIVMVFLPACRDARMLTVGPECNVRATVRDLTALDGCGFVLELPNGVRLSPDAQVWEGFTPYEGQQVMIRFQEINRATTCQVGRPVHIYCITEIQPTSGQD